MRSPFREKARTLRNAPFAFSAEPRLRPQLFVSEEVAALDEDLHGA